MGFMLAAVLPVRCAACAAPAPDGLCGRCAAAAVALGLPNGGFVELADGIAAVGRFAYSGIVADAVRGMKLSGRWAAARPIGDALRRELAVPDWPVTFVPAPRRKRRDRGVDLPQVLAGPRGLGLLRSVGERPDQTDLTAAQRRSSRQGAFVAASRVPSHVVLFDDVRTTGATALAAGFALLQGGARRVLVVTLAVGGDAARAAAGQGGTTRSDHGDLLREVR